MPQKFEMGQFKTIALDCTSKRNREFPTPAITQVLFMDVSVTNLCL